MDPGSPHPPRGGDLRIAALWVVALALILILLNAVKPLHIDDPFIYRVAEQVRADPFDPYGFDIFWLQWPQPVHEELTPPVLPYWWATGLGLFGEHEVGWKLWMFPFALALAFALRSLIQRFAPEGGLPLLAMALLSPVVLPGFNLMQDFPAQALALAGLALYLRSADRDSAAMATLAGLAVGLATQTKYTSVAILGVILLHGLLFRRYRAALTTVGVGLLLFAAWEAVMTVTYGRGMLFGQLRYGLFWVPRSGMVAPLLRLVGATLPLVVPLLLAGIGAPPPWILGAGAALLAGFALLLVQPVSAALFLGYGIALGLLVGWLFWLRLRRQGEATSPVTNRSRPLMDWLLLGWVVIEIGTYFATSPFPAVRRIQGLSVVLLLLAARGAIGTYRRRGLQVPFRPIAAAGVALALAFFAVDLVEARAQRDAAAQVAAHVDQADGAGRTWFVGHWGFQYYAEKLGMQPVVPDRSRLAAGDRLAIPHGIDRQRIRLGPGDAILEQSLEFGTGPPLGTGFGYYGGDRPLHHLAGPRLRVEIYRVLRPVVPESDWSAEQLADWSVRAGGRTAAAAVPALTRELDRGGPGARRLAAFALAYLKGSAAPAEASLRRALADREVEVRYHAARALGFLDRLESESRRALERASHDPDPRVAEAARQALEGRTAHDSKRGPDYDGRLLGPDAR